MAATVTVAPFPAGTPCPFVDVLVNNPPPAAVSATVTRTHGGRVFKVRGLVGLATSSAMTGRDYEAPFDTVLTYQASFTAADGSSLGFTPTVTVTLASTVPNTGWFHDPLDPSTAVRVKFLATVGAEITRAIPSEELRVKNRSLGVILGGVRNGVTQVVLDCATLTTAEGAKFDALFGTYDEVSIAVVVVRAAAPIPLPRLLIASIPDPKRRPHNLRSGGQVIAWGLVGTEVQPPAPAIVKALLTYQDFTDFYATYAEFTAAYPNYVTATRDYSVKGI